jgi:hypothetical protein
VLEILNSSRIHEVPHGLPKRNPEFSFTLPRKGMSGSVTLHEPEAFKIICDVHPWESSWCHVMTHPFFAVTDARGQFMIRGLPSGEYDLEFWHEHGSLAARTQRVRVREDQPVRIEPVTFTPRERPRLPRARS